jgi:tRNA modification GTPase
MSESITSALPGSDDVIAAIATASGRGALAVIRVSGAAAMDVVARVVRPWPVTPRHATLARVVDPASGDDVDQAMVVAYPAPATYTGEPLVELTTHGGVAAPAAVLAALVAAGAREALPGEFTRRAVLHGKLDLLQAEAVADMIDARSGAMRRAALAQLDGGLSRRVLALRDALLDVEALIAYDIDFPEEDDGPVPRDRVRGACVRALGGIDALLATAEAGELAREGALVVIAGPPNAGKSSLFNALLGRQRALVTPVPGTTRDAIEATMDVGAWPVRLVDTAGLRETMDVVERLGIEVSERYLAAAELVLACGETDDEVRHAADVVRAMTDAPVVAVRTKADVGGASRESGVGRGKGDSSRTPTFADRLGGPPQQQDGAEPANDRHHSTVPIIVSAERGDGLGDLVTAIEAALSARHGSVAGAADTPLVTRARHRRALGEAREELTQFVQAWDEELLPAPVAAVHLRSAVHALESLVGAVDVEDVLGRLFSTFCVGK